MLGGAASAASPARIVALDWSTAELALCLGLAPLAVSEAPGYRAWVETPTLPAGALDLGLRTQPNLELLAELRPDLLLTIPERRDLEVPLARIAPALSLPIYTAAHAPLAAAASATFALARRVGREDEARAVVARLETTLERCRQALAPVAGQPLAIIRFVDPRIVFIFGAGGMFQDVLDRLGLVNAWRSPPSRFGYAVVPLTSVAGLDPAARLLYLDKPVPADVVAMMRDDPLWRALPSVRRGDAAPLSTVWFFGALASAERFATILTARLTGRPETPPG